MDLYEASRVLQLVHAQYLRWRETRAAVRALPSGSPLQGWLADECAALDQDASPPDQPAAQERLEFLGARIKERLRTARRDHWHQQGKLLRYGLIVVENRLEAIDAHTAEVASTTVDRQLHELREQADTLRSILTGWESQRLHATHVCSADEIALFIADPYQEADKEHLERILERADASQLPHDLVCIHLTWDNITGDVLTAEIARTRPARPRKPLSRSHAEIVQDHGLPSVQPR